MRKLLSDERVSKLEDRRTFVIWREAEGSLVRNIELLHDRIKRHRMKNVSYCVFDDV